MKNNEFQVYLDLVRDYLDTNKKRLLTEKEEEIVVAHLRVIALTYCNDPKTAIRGCSNGNITRVDSKNELGITQVLSIETAKKVSEIHPDFPTPTQEQVDQRVAEVLAVQNYLKSEEVK